MVLKFVNSLILVICLIETVTGSINYVDKTGQLHNLNDFSQIKSLESWAAWASFENKVNVTGWAQLEITTNGLLNDSVQAYSSGLIEGYLSSELIQYNWINNIQHYCDNSTDYCNRLFAFIETNIEFTKSQIEKFGETDPYWHQIELSLIQLTGIEDGYEYVRNGFRPLGPRIDLKPNGLILLNLIAEIDDLESVLERYPKVFDADDVDNGHCSAIVKVLEDGTDLFVSHNTWTRYSMLLRVMKRYNLNYRNISGHSVAFSSYPGVILSLDDFYVISSGLTVMETSISNFNNSLWANVVAEKVVFEFIRNTVANRLARNGKEWTQIFSKYNSGTYNNQFMIVDYKLFQKGVHPSNLSNNLIWILEQMPGYIESGDVTEVLRRQHYWPSYNIPYFQSVYEISGYESRLKLYGDLIVYNRTVRALLFRRDQNKVTDMKSLYKLMRYNDFKNDPLSRCNCTPPYTAFYAIASRGDLNDPKGRYQFARNGFRSSGATDVKMINSELISKLEIIATSGPTYEQQAPFQWSHTNITGVLHSGHPDLFKFPPVQMKWSPSNQIPMKF